LSLILKIESPSAVGVDAPLSVPPEFLAAADLLEREQRSRGRDHDMVHIYDACCVPFDGYVCGTPVPPNDLIVEHGEIECVVCVDLDQARAMKCCRRCGEPC
jgi:hypothetical protein